MMKGFPEKDWKVLRRLKPLALERLTRRILDGAQAIIASAEDGKSHDAYLNLYKYIDDQDKEVAICFDDWRRSTAILTLARSADGTFPRSPAISKDSVNTIGRMNFGPTSKCSPNHNIQQKAPRLKTVPVGGRAAARPQT